MSTAYSAPPQPPETPAGPQPSKPRWYRRRLFLVIVVVAVGLIAGIIAATAGTNKAAPVAQPQASSSAPVTPSSSAPAAPASSAPAQASAAPTGPTVSQQQALESAKSYLDIGKGFSRAGLIKQLTSQYGEGFSKADAIWAVNHSGADWNAQAVMAAKGYLEMGGFSRSRLIEQLTSAYGEQFTLAQATYAVNQVGL